jgi:hypothetical protein
LSGWQVACGHASGRKTRAWPSGPMFAVGVLGVRHKSCVDHHGCGPAATG